MAPIHHYDLPFNERPDLTPYLIHLTRKNGRRDGLDVLEKILREGCILGTTQYFVSKKQKAACFMDVPFVALKYVCSEDNSKRYGPYGLVLTKVWAYRNRRARPVLYLSTAEQRKLCIPDNELWRVVRFQYHGSEKA